MAEPALRLESLVKRFGSHAAVAGIDLAVAPGEFVTLLGPSGCGKTTTLNLIAGFLMPDGGHIELNGRRIEELPPFRRDLGMVFQDYALFPHMTVTDNVAFGLKMRKVATDEISRRVTEALSLVKLDGFGARRPNQLSGGQRQRVAIARAILKNPAILILDEATSSLDSESERLVQIALDRLMEGRTTFIIAHRLATVRNADQIAVIEAGRVVEFGTHDELSALPAGLYRRLSTLQFGQAGAAGLDADIQKVWAEAAAG